MTSRSKQKCTRKSTTKRCECLMKNDIDIIHHLPKAFMIFLVVAIIVSFLCGCIARVYIISNGFAGGIDMPIRGRTPLLMTDEYGIQTTQTQVMMESLSLPKLLGRKEAPTATYSHKTFPPITVAVAASSAVLLQSDSIYPCIHPMTRKNLTDASSERSANDLEDFSTRTTIKPMTMKTFKKSRESNIGDVAHYPSGQHLVSNEFYTV